jgi:ketopantoate reductase PanE/ApbA-like protein
MIVEPIPPGWNGAILPGKDYNVWLEQIMGVYGRGKPSMLQDFERGRLTEIDFINGYVAQVGKQIGIPVPMNAAITDLVHQIERGTSFADSKGAAKGKKIRVARVVTCFARKSWLRLKPMRPVSKAPQIGSESVNASLTPCVGLIIFGVHCGAAGEGARQPQPDSARLANNGRSKTAQSSGSFSIF